MRCSQLQCPWIGWSCHSSMTFEESESKEGPCNLSIALFFCYDTWSCTLAVGSYMELTVKFGNVTSSVTLGVQRAECAIIPDVMREVTVRLTLLRSLMTSVIIATMKTDKTDSSYKREWCEILSTKQNKKVGKDYKQHHLCLHLGIHITSRASTSESQKIKSVVFISRPKRQMFTLSTMPSRWLLLLVHPSQCQYPTWPSRLPYLMLISTWPIWYALLTLFSAELPLHMLLWHKPELQIEMELN